MDPWTPEDRNALIDLAINTKESRGQKGPYHYSVLPKLNGNEQEDIRRNMLTEALADSIYKTTPELRNVSLSFYKLLMQKLSSNSYTGPYLNGDIIVVIKGSNAYAFVTEEKYSDEFPFSDLDVMIYINPYLDDAMFNQLKQAVRVAVLQTISQYKRLLDHMLFLNKPIDGIFLDEKTITSFKEVYTKTLDSIDLPDGAKFVSPFVTDEIRNYCSRNSFLIKKSITQENSVVKIEVPHFDRCERIPLRRTPLFCSYNDTIDFSRGNNEATPGHFDLYRIRFNNKYIETDIETGEITHEERVPADFIDITIASKDDAELIEFWNKGRCVCLYDKYSNLWMAMPDIHSCIADLYKMLHVYECPESKRGKRTQKLNKLIEIVNNMIPIQLVNHLFTPAFNHPPPSYNVAIQY